MSLYKGYGVYSLAILIWMSVLPQATDYLMEKMPLYIDPKEMVVNSPKQPQSQSQQGSVEAPVQYNFDDLDDDDDYD